jgi:hypothetical protein
VEYRAKNQFSGVSAAVPPDMNVREVTTSPANRGMATEVMTPVARAVRSAPTSRRKLFFRSTPDGEPSRSHSAESAYFSRSEPGTAALARPRLVCTAEERSVRSILADPVRPGSVASLVVRTAVPPGWVTAVMASPVAGINTAPPGYTFVYRPTP